MCMIREKIHIPKTKPFISFIGDANNPPTITGNDTASVTRGGTALRTFQSATVAVDADYFIASNIIFQVSIFYSRELIAHKPDNISS